MAGAPLVGVGADLRPAAPGAKHPSKYACGPGEPRHRCRRAKVQAVRDASRSDRIALSAARCVRAKPAHESEPAAGWSRLGRKVRGGMGCSRPLGPERGRATWKGGSGAAGHANDEPDCECYPDQGNADARPVVPKRCDSVSRRLLAVRSGCEAAGGAQRRRPLPAPKAREASPTAAPHCAATTSISLLP